MFEKVNPSHPDKIADRIAGAIVDLAYKQAHNPHIAVEVLIGHGCCYVIIETDTSVQHGEIKQAIQRIAGNVDCYVDIHKQDKHLNDNQQGRMRCGDNGIFKGVPSNWEEIKMSAVARDLYKQYPYDGKFIIDGGKIITICQSNASTQELKKQFPDAIVNPLGDWTGGTDVDSGATNRKLGSDMGRAVTGGGLHGKDLSKADVSINIYAHLLAEKLHKEVEMRCSIGDESIEGVPYEMIVETARKYIKSIGGFEKFAEWGLI